MTALVELARREPAAVLALVSATYALVTAVAARAVTEPVVVAFVGAVLALLVRSQVTPVVAPRDAQGRPLTPDQEDPPRV